MITGGVDFGLAAQIVAPIALERETQVRGPRSAAGVDAPQETDDVAAPGETEGTENERDEKTERRESPDGLTEEERQIVSKLAQRDREVRAHENAHLAAAGGLARGVSYSYETGPDGKRYAVGGEVSIDTSPVPGDPEATLQKARQIQAAANAPAEPSGQDRAVAAQAAAMAQKALLEIAEQKRAELDGRNRESQVAQFEGPEEDRVGELLSLVA